MLKILHLSIDKFIFKSIYKLRPTLNVFFTVADDTLTHKKKQQK